ncbi:MAG: UpxY family transcription antiterminator [Melioribacteraceae bacterium]|nr:UpxY family transcription antiterminator [Melioribacteraceae bacterium]
MKEIKRYWYALYTKPKHEFKAADRIRSIDIEYYLPTITTVKQWSDRKKKVTEPLFKGYIFVKANETERFLVLALDGIVNTVCFGGKPSRIPDWEIENLKRMMEIDPNVIVSEKIPIGSLVKVIEGPFAGIEGNVCEEENNERMLGITVNLLRRSVLVKLPMDNVIETKN